LPVEERAQDPWARWVLRHSGGDDRREFRDRVLDNAGIREGDVALDVGTGDGLVAFGALERVGAEGGVVFSDVSADLVEHCRVRAAELGVDDRCQFIVVSADNLTPVSDGSVDVVTTRSVLIYVTDKERAFREFFRVLRPGGRLSIFEPINSFGYPEPDNRFIGYDVAPVAELARKVKAVYDRIQPPDDPMLDFDERDLVICAEDAGFVGIRLTLELSITDRPWSATPSWDEFLETSGNPRLPPIREVLHEALPNGERERFCAYLRPLVESGIGEGRLAVAYLRAAKGS
jgi:arsenite methyltransferase